MSINSILAEVAVTSPEVDSSALVEQIKSMLGGVFTVENLIPVIAGALGITAGLFIFWFGYRFIKRKAEKGLKKGSL